MLWQKRETKFSTPTVIPVAFFLASVAIFSLNAHCFSQLRKNSFASAEKLHSSRRTRLSMSVDNRPSNNRNEKGLKIAVVGAGPSGLLLASLLLKNNDGKDEDNSPEITLFDSRSDPRTNEIEGKAYALGISVRGRTAIRRTDPALWEAIKSKGYESGRFNLHLSISKKRDLVFPLRSDSKKSLKENLEPSLLIYQSELCATLLQNLEEQHGLEKKKDKDANNGVEIHFDTRVVDCNLDTMIIQATTNSSSEQSAETSGVVTEAFGPFDLIVGCDGVNSRVRDAIDTRFKEFVTTSERLPGFLKVARLGYSLGKTKDGRRPPYDPKAVKLLLPSGVFIIPKGEDGSCCLLFSGRGYVDGGEKGMGLPMYLSETQDVTVVEEALRKQFPRWKEESFPELADQLMKQDLTGYSAYKVRCNTYHYQNKAVLVGDAAHSTGGVSGQGLNSALMDALILYECLQQQGQSRGEKSLDLEASLLEYSMRQVPEGRALYDLFFGPNPQGFRKKLLWSLKIIRDSLFQGKLGIGEDTLRTRLSSDLTPFSTVRRERDYFYKQKDGSGGFLSEDEFRRQLEELHKISYR